MRKFIIKIVVCISIVAIALLIIELSISFIVSSKSNKIFTDWNYIYSDTTYHDMVINGNSRALTQYDPKLLDSILGVNTYNLGIDGSGINRQMIKYDRFVQYHNSPKYLIQNIDFCTMNNSSGYQREQFYPYFFIDRELRDSTDEYEHYSWADKNVLGYRYMGFIQMMLTHLLSKEKVYKGYHGSESKWDPSTLLSMSNVVVSSDSLMICKFHRYIEKLQKQGIKVIFVYAPIYYKVYEKMLNKEDMYTMYDSIASKFSIPILDYNEMSLCYDTAYFYNATHLNRIGAELFTTKLAHDIDSLGLLN